MKSAKMRSKHSENPSAKTTKKRKSPSKPDAAIGSSKTQTKNSKILFDDDGNTIDVDNIKSNGHPRHPNRMENTNSDMDKRWFEEYENFNKNDEELIELKDSQIQELTDECRKCFETEESNFLKRNPSDGKWLQTALHKGTSKDRANSGALLVQSNPLGNVKSLETLIGLTKVLNKSNTEAIQTITQLFISGLLPPYRKLLSLPMRGACWQALKKTDIEHAARNEILAYWYFETLLKDHYFQFLRNLQAAMQGTQDSNKNQAIVCASRLLTYAPEKEQMLLSMLVNKLGDPSNRVASKALYHLTEVAHKHPAMCTVITKETEKLLFRNNITEHAQHFALCFLGQIAPTGNAEVCTRLVDICFSFFKVVVQKGAVNTKVMQAILRCLKRAIVDAHSDFSTTDGGDGFLSKDIQDTMYRLIHLADIQIALQTFSLLLQILSVKSMAGKDRYYNALYKKMLDIKLTNVGPKAASQFFHIIHRSIHIDSNVSRALAFIKRLLQVAFTFPVPMTCGCLIVVNKILKLRPELVQHSILPVASQALDVAPESIIENNSEIKVNKYDPFHRCAEFSGAQFSLKTELMRLCQHFHPTVQIFSENIRENKSINFYGDPLQDFSLTHFLERFSFRNPRKLDEKHDESFTQLAYKNRNGRHGGRGVPVKSLTEQNCTEDERFIFQYLERKRAKLAAIKNDDNESVDDNEFEAYLDSLGGKDDDLDFLNELGDELKEDLTKTEKTKKKSSKADDIDDAGDWDDNEDNDNSDANDDMVDDNDSDADGSISLDEDNENDSDIFDDESDDESVIIGSDIDDDEDDEPKAKKIKSMSGKDFKQSLKNTTNMSSLFAAADDFAELLEETSKSKTHGTLGDIFNKDKASEKQMQWEANRLRSTGYSGQRSFKKTNKKFVNKRKEKANKRFK